MFVGLISVRSESLSVQQVWGKLMSIRLVSNEKYYYKVYYLSICLLVFL